MTTKLDPTLVTGQFARVIGSNMTQWWLPDDDNLEADAIRSFGHFTPLDRHVDGAALHYATDTVGTYIVFQSIEAARAAVARDLARNHGA